MRGPMDWLRCLVCGYPRSFLYVRAIFVADGLFKF